MRLILIVAALATLSACGASAAKQRFVQNCTQGVSASGAPAEAVSRQREMCGCMADQLAGSLNREQFEAISNGPAAGMEGYATISNDPEAIQAVQSAVMECAMGAQQ